VTELAAVQSFNRINSYRNKHYHDVVKNQNSLLADKLILIRLG
jgi:hypothetical protein